ncbi:MarR family winged helix-turn-helix transcriptional regulator [Isoptericola nanjingensis]|jgi:DNA-binding MarR family transcriptional regulator|uniref:MarR family winged helix-turn-helix transcriptional regulator n=1 Tax=Isoptericola TaxID=254250 RepID=UPI0035E80192
MSTTSRDARPGSAAPWLDEHQERAWRAFRRMTTSVRAGTARDLADTGLSEPDYEVLSTLVERPGTTSTLHEQAAKMGWSRSRLSRHSSRMEVRGLIARAPDPADGRGCLLVLTAAGREALRAATPTHLESVRRRFADRLDADDLRDLLRIADKLGDRSEEAAPLDG